MFELTTLSIRPTIHKQTNIYQKIRKYKQLVNNREFQVISMNDLLIIDSLEHHCEIHVFHEWYRHLKIVDSLKCFIFHEQLVLSLIHWVISYS